MHENTLGPATKSVLLNLAGLHLPNNFYLSGGTALALHLGHRESEDLDFFTESDFNPSRLQIQLESLGKLENTELDKNTLNTYIDGVKLQFLGYPYPLLEPTVFWNSTSLSSVIDISLTKFQTIGMRGSKKDFIDIFFILKEFDLEKLFSLLPKKYPNTDLSIPHLLKSFVYYDDADSEPMPRMHQTITWEEIKAALSQQIKSLKLVDFK